MAEVGLTARIVEVIADLGDSPIPAGGRYRYGSGCIVRGRTVLTAAHVVNGAKSIEIRDLDKNRRPVVMDSIFMGDAAGPGPDLALIEVDDPTLNLSPIRLARVDRDSTMDDIVLRQCSVVGFPRFAQTPRRDTFHGAGFIPVLGNLVLGLLSVEVIGSRHPRLPIEGGLDDSEWSGISGSPVLASGMLLGVVSEHAPRQGSSMLTAVPLTALVRDEAHPEWGPGVSDPAAWWYRLGARGIANLAVLPVRAPAHGVLGVLPDFVPSRVADRENTRDGLRALLGRPQTVLVELLGASGVGKTALAAEIARDHFPGQSAFLTASGYPGVGVEMVLGHLADAVTDADQRARLHERLAEPEADSLTKLDDVLTELGTSRVLLVIDSAEDLLDPHGRLRDDDLASMITETANWRGHGVKILFVTATSTLAAGRTSGSVRNQLAGVEQIFLEDRLPLPGYREFVADLIATRRSASSILSIPDLARVTGCHPRRTEILVGIPPDSMSRADLIGIAHATDLSNVIVASLDDRQIRALEVLAVCRRPVEVAAVAFLVEETEETALGTLAELAERRVIRRRDRSEQPPPYQHLYYLPADEARRFARALRPELVADLTRRSAGYFETVARREHPNCLADCGDWLNAIDLHLAAGNERHALDLMVELDERHLREWGHSDALLPWLPSLAGRLTEAQDRIVHASLWARACVQQGRLQEGIDKLIVAGRLNAEREDLETQVAVRIQLANYTFRIGRVRLASRHYESVIDGLPPNHPRIAEARANLALCQAQTGEFPAALRNIAGARLDLRRRRVVDRDSQLLEIRLQYNRALIDLEQGDAEGCLEEVIGARATAAGLEASPLVARFNDLEARVSLYQHRIPQAVAMADDAWRIAARIGNPELCRIAGATLATSLLRQGEYRQALVAARAAARHRRSPFVAEALTIVGVAAFRYGAPIEQAKAAFGEAIRHAEALLMKEDRIYRARESLAIARSGLALLGDGGPDEVLAVVAYRDAIEGANGRGARHRRWELFDILTSGQPAETLAEVRNLLLG